MAFRGSTGSATISMGSSAMQAADHGLSKPYSSPFDAKVKPSSSPPRLRPSDSSMLDLTLPLSHATSLVRRVFSEALLLLRLAVRLWSYLGVGWKWFVQLMRLVLYATLLLPGFIQMIFFYFFSPRVQRSITYGPKPRQRLDLYLPKHPRPHAASPVVIYITGGAWTIGYKAWGALLARRLSQRGVLVACLDYRNFPQGDALDMLEDVNTGIAWVLSRVHRFGGDPDSVTLVGQSAGGHLAGLALVKQAEQAASGLPTLGAAPAWSPTAFRSFVGVSGAYDLAALAEHLHRRGLYKNLFERIMSLSTDNHSSDRHDNGNDCNGNGCNGNGCNGNGCNDQEDCGGGSSCNDGSNSSTCNGRSSGSSCVDTPRCGSGVSVAISDCGACDGVGGGEGLRVGTSHDASGCKGGAHPAYSQLSPLQAARRLPPGAAAMLPNALLIHGTADKTVPCEGSAQLSEALEAAGARCRCVLFPGKTHTAFLLEDPMRGGRDLLMDTVLGAVTGAGDGVESHVYRTLCPGFLCDLASWVCPF